MFGLDRGPIKPADYEALSPQARQSVDENLLDWYKRKLPRDRFSELYSSYITFGSTELANFEDEYDKIRDQRIKRLKIAAVVAAPFVGVAAVLLQQISTHSPDLLPGYVPPATPVPELTPIVRPAVTQSTVVPAMSPSPEAKATPNPRTVDVSAELNADSVVIEDTRAFLLRYVRPEFRGLGLAATASGDGRGIFDDEVKKGRRVYLNADGIAAAVNSTPQSERFLVEATMNQRRAYLQAHPTYRVLLGRAMPSFGTEAELVLEIEYADNVDRRTPVRMMMYGQTPQSKTAEETFLSDLKPGTEQLDQKDNILITQGQTVDGALFRSDFNSNNRTFFLQVTPPSPYSYPLRPEMQRADRVL